MPRCEGRPDGPCPLKKNDKSVHLSQGDLMLCSACENFRFPASASTSAVNPGIKATHTTTHTNTTSSLAERQPAEPAERLDGTKLGSSCTVESTLNEPNSGDSSSATSMPTNCIVDNELLTYVKFYRNAANVTNTRKTVLNFYSPAEISQAKATLMATFTCLNATNFCIGRWGSSSRPQHEAEIDDIIGAMEFIDNTGGFQGFRFMAENLDRIPKYGPEELNVCAVVDRQRSVEVSLTTMTEKVDVLEKSLGVALSDLKPPASITETLMNLDKKVS